MASHTAIFDAVIRHRLQLQRYARKEAAVILGLFGREDAKLVELLRGRLPRLSVGNVGAAHVAELLDAVRAMRGASFETVRDAIRGDLVELGRVEGVAVGRLARGAIGLPVPFNPVRQQAIAASLSQPIFGGGRGAGVSLEAWFADLRAADQGRLTEALQLGIRRQEPVDVQVRRIAGTRANRYADGLLAIPRRAAETAVRTGVVHVANVAQREWNRQNADVVIGSEWVSMLDKRTCEECEGLHGGFAGNIGRPAPDGMVDLGDVAPPAHPSCRCTLVPVFDLDALTDKVPDEDQEAA